MKLNERSRSYLEGGCRSSNGTVSGDVEKISCIGTIGSENLFSFSYALVTVDPDTSS